MAKRVTIAGLQREKAELEEKVEHLDGIITRQERDDEAVRATFARLLQSYAPVHQVSFKMHGFLGEQTLQDQEERKERVPNWHEIAVLIGELKADANYAMVLEGRDEFRRQSQQKSELIGRMRKAMMQAGVEFNFNGEELL